MVSKVGVAILGVGGWMGKCHSLAYRNLPLLFPDHGTEAEIRWIVDSDGDRLASLARAYPGSRTATDFEVALSDPEVDLVDICLPDSLHYEVARAALDAGKNVYCEKPFTSTAAEALELADLAEAKGLVTRIGHNFPKNPVHELTRDLLDRGELGDLVLFRASMHVDVLADPEAPFMWRCDGRLAPTGVVGDVASHIFSFVDMLIGPMQELIADVLTTTPERPVVEGFGYGVQAERTADSKMREVTNSDMVNLLCTFPNGGRGVIDVSRVASGRSFLQTYEIYGTRGAVSFDYDEVNRLRVHTAGSPGFRAIDVGPERPSYAAFLPVPNFALGYNEFKAIEVAEVVRSVATGEPRWPTFRNGHAIMRTVDACFRSSERRQWVRLDD